MNKQSYVYILTNKWGTTLYTGVTSDLVKRIHQHKEKQADSFSRRYDLNKLVYFEVYEDIQYAIQREKQIKAGNRQKKIEMINNMNPDWKDLYSEIVG